MKKYRGKKSSDTAPLNIRFREDIREISDSAQANTAETLSLLQNYSPYHRDIVSTSETLSLLQSYCPYHRDIVPTTETLSLLQSYCPYHRDIAETLA